MKLDKNLAQLTAENTRLRAALAHSDRPCVYCTLPADEWIKCQHGFPGCSRADDAMGCPELGASLRVADLTAEVERLSDQIDGLSSELSSAVEVAWRRGATEWVKLNYPTMAAALAGGQQ